MQTKTIAQPDPDGLLATAKVAAMFAVRTQTIVRWAEAGTLRRRVMPAPDTGAERQTEHIPTSVVHYMDGNVASQEIITQRASHYLGKGQDESGRQPDGPLAEYLAIGLELIALHGAPDGVCTCRRGHECPHPGSTRAPRTGKTTRPASRLGSPGGRGAGLTRTGAADRPPGWWCSRPTRATAGWTRSPGWNSHTDRCR